LLRYWLPFLCACQPASEPARRLVFDFEEDEGWVVERGDVWAEPSFRGAPVRRHGQGFLGTAETEEGKRDPERVGTLRSPPFVVDHDYLVFRAGVSGELKGCTVSLRVPRSKEDLHRLAPKDGRMLTYIWDVRDVYDERVVMRLIDRGAGEKACSVHIDWVRLVDE
jgi:hypothetical protein